MSAVDASAATARDAAAACAGLPADGAARADVLTTVLDANAAFFLAWAPLARGGHLIPLDAAAAAFLSADDSRLPAPSPQTPLLPGDARRALPAAACGPPLPAAEAALAAALGALGARGALPRACGAAPADAAWAAAAGDAAAPLRALAVSDVWTLLKASDRVRDALAARAPGAPRWIELRPWASGVAGGAEVRCFLNGDGALAALALRRAGAGGASAALQSAAGRAAAVAAVAAATRGLARVAAAAGGAAVDVVIDGAPSAPRVRVLNVRARGGGGGGGDCLVSWADVDALPRDAAEPLFRVADAAGGSGGGVHFHPLAAHAFPDEVFDYAAAAMPGGGGGEAGSGPVARAAARPRGAGNLATGWAALVEGLEAQGLFGGESESDEGGE